MECKILGLDWLCTWIDEQNLHDVAFTNVPCIDHDLWFERDGLIIGDERGKAKPDSYLYLKARKVFNDNVKSEEFIVYEDPLSGPRLVLQLVLLLLLAYYQNK